MKYTVKFEEGTLDNFHDAISYYEKISDNLADRFHDEFWAKIDTVKETPLHYQARYRNIRIAYTKTFPFSIHFLIEGTIIRILKILHQKQYYK
ncbi:type II toxin-antitoxin system RelE/ParE family toxin [Hyunsoonleella ulvae]|uniref:type II toxin-antitoxin system RelE/ParE family toxin n=1 Tax=Hyunsoonleella ulvae TaxID=2799948 RepID=UPI0019396079|nr:type II toxin-antitoxin system RelE/ParE family toxin [Hyunsoonleella ulvae]